MANENYDAPQLDSNTEPVAEPQTNSVDNLPKETPTVVTPKEKPAKKPVDTFQKRIGKIHAKHQEELGTARSEIAELRAAMDEFKKNNPTKEKEYTNAEDYLKDKVKELVAAERASEKEAATAAQPQAPVVDENWNTKLKDFFTKNPDVDIEEWRMAVSDLDPVANDHIGDFCRESDVGPELLHEIFSNDEHIEKLNTLTGRKREKYLSNLEDKIEKAQSEGSEDEESSNSVDNLPKEPVRAALPKPPSTNKGRSGAVGLTLAEAAKKTDLKEYFKLLKAQKKNK